MHRTDRHVTASGFNVLVQHLERQPGMLDCHMSPVELRWRTDEHAHFVRHHASIAEVCKPCTDQAAFVLGACQNLYNGWWPVEDRNCADALFGVAVDIREFGTQQTIGL